MSVAGIAKGVGNFFVPVEGSLKRADTYLDAVAGNGNSLMRGLAGVGVGIAYGKMAYTIGTDMLPETIREAGQELKSGHQVEAAGTILLQTVPAAAATGLLAANGAAAVIRGFSNDSANSARASV